MKKISIAVDLDSTLNNFEKQWIERDYNTLYNVSLTTEDMISWNAHEYVKPECGTEIYDIYKQPGYFRNLDLKDKYTQDSFNWLCDYFDVYIVSACYPGSVVDKVEWINHYFPHFDTSSKFVSCSSKGIINTDWLIDDGPHNIVDFKQESILMDAAYNRHLSPQENNFIRLSNWREIKQFFEVFLIKKERFA